LNQDIAYIKTNKKKDRAKESLKIASSSLFKFLIDENAKFVENAYRNEDQNDEFEGMNLAKDEVSKSNNLRKQIYKKATSHLEKLKKNPKNAKAKLKLNKLNKKIKKQNLKDKFPKKDLENFLIYVDTFIVNFELTKVYCESLDMNLANDIARDKIININKILNQLNERHGYSRIWLITLSSLLETNGVRLIATKFSKAEKLFEVEELFEATKSKVVDLAS